MKKSSFTYGLFGVLLVAVFSFVGTEKANAEEAIAHPGDGYIEQSMSTFGCPHHGHTCVLLPTVVVTN